MSKGPSFPVYVNEEWLSSILYIIYIFLLFFFLPPQVITFAVHMD